MAKRTQLNTLHHGIALSLGALGTVVGNQIGKQVSHEVGGPIGTIFGGAISLFIAYWIQSEAGKHGYHQ